MSLSRNKLVTFSAAVLNYTREAMNRFALLISRAGLAALLTLLVTGCHATEDPDANHQVIAKYQIAASQEPNLSPQQMTMLLRRKIKYVFVLYQENRSFDSYFGTFPGAEGIFSRKPEETPGFYQPLINVDGATSTIHPFRIGPEQHAADTDDVDHSHPMIVAKMDIEGGAAKMNRFALSEEQKFMKSGKPSLR